MHTSAAMPRDPRVDACAFILHGLLQRLEHQQPGLLAGMIQGTEADRQAIAQSPRNPQIEHALRTSDEALRMLRLAHGQSQIPWSTLPGKGAVRPPRQ